MANSVKRKSVLQLVSQFEESIPGPVNITKKQPSFVSYLVEPPSSKQINSDHNDTNNIQTKNSDAQLDDSTNKHSSDSSANGTEVNNVLNKIIDDFSQLSDTLSDYFENTISDCEHCEEVNLNNECDTKILRDKTLDLSVDVDLNVYTDVEERSKQRMVKLRSLEDTITMRNQLRDKVEKINVEPTDSSDDVFESEMVNVLIKSTYSDKSKHCHYENYKLPSTLDSENINMEISYENDLYQTLPSLDADKVQLTTTMEESSNRTSGSSQSSDLPCYANPVYDYLEDLKDTSKLQGINKKKDNSHGRKISDVSNFSINEDLDMNSDYVTITKYEPVLHGNMQTKKRSSDELHYKTLLTIFPDVKKSQTEMSKVMLSSKNVEMEEVQKYKDTKEYIVDELINTEEYYIKKLQLAVQKYQEPLKAIIGLKETLVIFNIFEEILKGTSRMITDFERVRLDYEAIGQVFLNNMKIFEMYPTYCKNRNKSYQMVKKHETLIESIESSIGDRLGLASHLTSPIIRLAKYEQLLNRLQRHLERNGWPMTNVTAAANLIQNIAIQSNDLVEHEQHERIHDITYQSTATGKFIMRDSLRLLSPKKCNVVLFLFHNMIVFTKIDNNKEDNHIFYQSIDMDKLSLNEELNQPTTFSLTRNLRGPKFTFRLDARSADVKQKWMKVLTERLWEEFEEVKRRNTVLYNIVEY